VRPATTPVSTSRLTVRGLTVTVHRKRVRRLWIGVHHPDGRVVVSAPLRASDSDVRRAVVADLAWILRHRTRILDEERRAMLAQRPPARALTGETWWHFGEALHLEVQHAPGRARVVQQPGRLLLRVPADADDATRLAAIERWQRAALQAAIAPLVAVWAERLRVAPRFVGVKRMRTRWGSCVIEPRRIWIALELVTRPPEGLEYVVVHELVHLRVPSHGRRFVAAMDAHLPDWRDRRAALEAGSEARTYAPRAVADAVSDALLLPTPTDSAAAVGVDAALDARHGEAGPSPSQPALPLVGLALAAQG